ncbi:hypothetical protein AAHE18_04G081000 [Arachis hypogaea]|nr:uncharacterized protein DS421_4g113780 [Arachis hypogaea]
MSWRHNHALPPSHLQSRRLSLLLVCRLLLTALRSLSPLVTRPSSLAVAAFCSSLSSLAKGELLLLPIFISRDHTISNRTSHFSPSLTLTYYRKNRMHLSICVIVLSARSTVVF